MKRLLLIPIALAASAAFLASALPAFSADSGTVDAQVTVQAACITLDTTSRDFGSQPFSQLGSEWSASVAPVTVTNCGSAAKLYARGTDAKNEDKNAAAVTWTLHDSFVDTCTLGVNRFRLALIGTGGPVLLSTADKQLLEGAPLSPASAATISNLLTMPCTGSDGSGQTMTWQIVFTATQ